MKFCAQLKGANIEQLLELYLQALDMQATPAPAAVDVSTKVNGADGEETAEASVDADGEEVPSALLNVLSRADSSGPVMVAMTVAIFALYFLTAV